MDLNIGTAFWFAASGQGYTRKYSPEYVASLFDMCKDGRPLLRLGEDGAARGVGRSCASKIKEICCKEGCIKVSKAECVFRLCKLCCQKRARDIRNSRRQGVHNVPGEITAEESCDVHEIGSGFGSSQSPLEKDDKNNSEIKNKGNKKNMLSAVVVIKDGAAANDIRDNDFDFRQQCQVNANVSGGDPCSLSTPATINICVSISGVVKKEEDEDDDKDQHNNDINNYNYCTAARAVLIGAGADEQLAGYGRHRTCFVKGGEEALEQELRLDCARIWTRNLGRDDRCVSDRGREAWYPFLDENVVRFIQSMPLSLIADLSLPSGEGDKRILREAARQLGLRNSTTLVKRAIQFGSRIAQLTNSSQFGSHRKGKGTTKIKDPIDC